MSRQRVTARSERSALVVSRISNSPAAPRPIHGQTKAKANIHGEASGAAHSRRAPKKLHTHCGLNEGDSQMVYPFAHGCARQTAKARASRRSARRASGCGVAREPQAAQGTVACQGTDQETHGQRLSP